MVEQGISRDLQPWVEHGESHTHVLFASSEGSSIEVAVENFPTQPQPPSQIPEERLLAPNRTQCTCKGHPSSCRVLPGSFKDIPADCSLYIEQVE